ncbi:MAG: hypothetical protein ACJ795_18190, partial [Ktedonobacteraceae bacterium]
MQARFFEGQLLLLVEKDSRSILKKYHNTPREKIQVACLVGCAQMPTSSVSTCWRTRLGTALS